MISLPSPACLPAEYTTVPSYPSLCFTVYLLFVLHLLHFTVSHCLHTTLSTIFYHPRTVQYATLSAFLCHLHLFVVHCLRTTSPCLPSYICLPPTHIAMFLLPAYDTMLMVCRPSCMSQFVFFYFLFLSSRLYIMVHLFVESLSLWLSVSNQMLKEKIYCYIVCIPLHLPSFVPHLTTLSTVAFSSTYISACRPVAHLHHCLPTSHCLCLFFYSICACLFVPTPPPSTFHP